MTSQLGLCNVHLSWLWSPSDSACLIYDIIHRSGVFKPSLPLEQPEMQSSKAYIFTYSISVSNWWTIFQFVKLKTPFVFVITYVAMVEHCLEEAMFLFWWNSVRVLQCEMCSYGRDSFTQKGECRNEQSKACMKTCGKGLSVVWGNFWVGTVWFQQPAYPLGVSSPSSPFWI